MQIPKGGVAFFDSGIGGLTVLSACEKQLSDGLFYYYGDNHHAPYGNLPFKKIRKYVFKAFKQFKRLRVSAAVIACNTATAICVEGLRKKYSFPILGAEPAVYTAAKNGGKVLVLATKATCQSPRFKRLCEKASNDFPHAEICIRECPGLAEDVERNVHTLGYDFTSHLPRERADAVVLGCTHYIYIVEQIKRYYGCPVYDGNEGIARRLTEILGTDEGWVKNRDWQPLDEKKDKKMGCVTTKAGDRAECQKLTNKRSQKMPKKYVKTAVSPTVFFLGKQREYNQKVHEQMFVWLKRV